MLAMYVSDNHRIWDVSLAQISCALRTAEHEATNYSPYFINFGRSMVLFWNMIRKELAPKDSGSYLPKSDRDWMLRQRGMRRRTISEDNPSNFGRTN
ncbi:hypothetical protein JTB14_017766 [Gonioctena quinquepunctata]|nr:hypothetical protein JTB14_017766 [Gonioctena quinquepunctata]